MIINLNNGYWINNNQIYNCNILFNSKENYMFSNNDDRYVEIYAPYWNGDVEFPGGAERVQINGVGGYSYFNGNLVIPDSVTNLSNAFCLQYRWDKSVTLPPNITNCYNAFYNCVLYNQPVNIPDNTPVNCSHMFFGCNMMNSLVNVGDNVTNMSYMFEYCYNFNQPVYIPNSVTSCDYMFYYCNNFNQPITIPDSVTNCYSMFGSCKKLYSIIQIYGNSRGNYGSMFSGSNVKDVYFFGKFNNLSYIFNSVPTSFWNDRISFTIPDCTYAANLFANSPVQVMNNYNPKFILKYNNTNYYDMFPNVSFYSVNIEFFIGENVRNIDNLLCSRGYTAGDYPHIYAYNVPKYLNIEFENSSNIDSCRNFLYSNHIGSGGNAPIIVQLKNYDNITDYSYMFAAQNSAIKRSIYLSNFSINKNVVNMYKMFANFNISDSTYNGTTFDFNWLNECENYSYMFEYCNEFQNIFSNGKHFYFNGNNATMDHIFVNATFSQRYPVIHIENGISNLRSIGGPIGYTRFNFKNAKGLNTYRAFYNKSGYENNTYGVGSTINIYIQNMYANNMFESASLSGAYRQNFYISNSYIKYLMYNSQGLSNCNIFISNDMYDKDFTGAFKFNTVGNINFFMTKDLYNKFFLNTSSTNLPNTSTFNITYSNYNIYQKTDANDMCTIYHIKATTGSSTYLNTINFYFNYS